MFSYFDQWYDWWRLCAGFVCLFDLFILGRRFHMNRHHWNEKTRDYWYALTVWSFAGLVGSIQGITTHLGLTPSIVLITAGALSVTKALHLTGPWGSRDA